jgi:hypothetical protein
MAGEARRPAGDPSAWPYWWNYTASTTCGQYGNGLRPCFQRLQLPDFRQ